MGIGWIWDEYGKIAGRKHFYRVPYKVERHFRMAKVKNNIFVRGLSGSLGDQFVVRATKGGETVVAAKPAFSNERVFNAQQLAHQDAFRMAIAYARAARTQDVYVNKAEGTNKSAYNLAVADWFNQPEVLALNVSGWSGQVGETIRVQAQDDTYVANVRVVIRDANGAILEEGDAVRSDGLWWNYTAKSAVNVALLPQITAQAYDLAGNIGELAISL